MNEPATLSAGADDPQARPPWSIVLRALRETRGMTRDGWATRLGYSSSTVQRWERGATVPNAAQETALLTLVQSEGLLRSYTAGPLHGLTLTEEILHRLLADARGGPHTPANPATSRDADREPTIAASVGVLPVPATRCIGRERDIAALTRLLQDTRLLTLTGPGGSGKTRLALAVAETLRRTFRDGVWFVDLSAVSDPAGVLPVIAATLGVAEQAGRSWVAALATFLHGKTSLLVVDNLEQVIEAAPQFAELLAGAPGPRLLVTSRIPLHIAGEQEYPVLPLALPGRADAATAEQCADTPAVQLFVERAASVQPQFTLTTENAADVAEICRRLDGLPLAIELAAARVKLLPPAALLARLDRRLPLLTSGARSSPARQQTLRATIAWSWNLLEPAMQVLFRRLAVFAGGWTLDAAEAVCNLDGNLEMFDGLTTLVDHSLVRPSDVDGEPRFHLLATLREFALEMLAESGERETMQSRHAAYFCGVGEHAFSHWWQTGHHVAGWLEGHDLENLSAAVQWAATPDRSDLGLLLAASLGGFFYPQRPSEGLRWLELMLGLPGADIPTRARGKALFAAGHCATSQQDADRARAYYAEAVTVFRAVADLPWLSRALGNLATVVPEADHARELLAEALTLARQLGEHHTHAVIAVIAPLLDDDLPRAQTQMEEVLAFARELDADWLIMAALVRLADLLELQGQRDAAYRVWLEVLPLAETLLDRVVVGKACGRLAYEAASEGNLVRAATTWRVGVDAARDVGNTEVLSVCLSGLASLLTTLGQAVLAAQLLGASTALRCAAMPEQATVGWYHEVHDAAQTATRATLRPATFAEAWDSGQTLSLDQAAAIAITAIGALAPSQPAHHST